jgi:hypothetical protein
LKLEDDGEYGYRVSGAGYNDSYFYRVDVEDDDIMNLKKLEEFVRSIGFSGIECIMFSPRRSGRYRSACASPSKKEIGKARVTLDMH